MSFNRKKQKKNHKKFIKNARAGGIQDKDLDADEREYFLNILNILNKNAFEEIDEKESLANNVLEHIEGKEFKLAQSSICSKLVENIIGFSEPETFEKYTTALSENMRQVCTDRMASHVIQKVIEISFLRAVGKASLKTENEDDEGAPPVKKSRPSKLPNEFDYNLEKDFPQSHKDYCNKFVEKLGKFMLNNLEDFTQDTYAVHIMKTVIQSIGGKMVIFLKRLFLKCKIISGLAEPRAAFQRIKIDEAPKFRFKVPDEFKSVLQDFAGRLMMWPQFNDLPYDDLFKNIMIVICFSLKNTDKKLLSTFGKKMVVALAVPGENPEMLKCFDSYPSTKCLGYLCTLSGPKLLNIITEEIFSKNIAELAKHEIAYKALAKYIKALRDSEAFEKVFEEIVEQPEIFKEIFQAEKYDVVYEFAAACVRLQTKQGPFVTAITSILKLTGVKDHPEAIFECLTKMHPFVDDLKEQELSALGCSLVSTLLKFNKPIFILNSMFAHNVEYLLKVLCSPSGSFISNAMYESKFVGEKSREKFTKCFEEHYADMATDKFGSRALELMFENASEGQQIKIAKELSDNKAKIASHFIGKFIFTNFRIDTFKLSQEQWKVAIKKAKKSEKLFKGIV